MLNKRTQINQKKRLKFLYFLSKRKDGKVYNLWKQQSYFSAALLIKLNFPETKEGRASATTFAKHND